MKMGSVIWSGLVVPWSSSKPYQHLSVCFDLGKLSGIIVV